MTDITTAQDDGWVTDLEWGAKAPDTPWRFQEREWKRFGWARASRAGSIWGSCPAPVLGKRCTSTWRDDATKCVCDKLRDLYPYTDRGIDHGRYWRRIDDGEVILTSENYYPSLTERIPWLQVLADHGVSVRASGWSPWYPGRTTLLILHRRGADLGFLPTMPGDFAAKPTMGWAAL